MEEEIKNKYIGVNEDCRGLKIYTYTQKAHYEEHWNEYTIKARGLVMDREEVMLQCIPKFFNLGQEGAAEFDVRLAQITEKNDGYLIQIKNTEEYGMIITSKGSFDSPMARKARSLIDASQFKEGWTYICELCCNFEGDEGTIVKRWGNTEKLVCWAVLDPNNEEQDISKVELPECLERVRVFSFDEMNEYLKRKDVEGVVAHYGSERVKIKTERYLELHRILSNMTPKRVLEYFENGVKLENLDLPDEFLPQAKSWYADFQKRYDHIFYTAKHYQDLSKDWTDKQVALCHPVIPPLYRSLVFALRKNKGVDSIIFRTLRNELKIKMEEQQNEEE